MDHGGEANGIDGAGEVGSSRLLPNIMLNSTQPSVTVPVHLDFCGGVPSAGRPSRGNERRRQGGR